MSWMAVAIGGSALISGVASSSAANSAADAQGDAAKKNRQLQQLGMNQQMAMFEPNRALGYGAASDLASLYGYAMPGYTPLNQLISGNIGGGPGGSAYGSSVINVGKGQDSSGGIGGMLGAAFGSGNLGDRLTGGVFDNGQARDNAWGGSIDPLTGTVNVKGHEAWNDDFTNYLRTGQGRPKGGEGKFYGLKKAIDNLRGSGWTYDPNRATQQQAGPQGQAGNMSRFFTSPDYQFRRDEGQRGIGNSFAARGGASSGNALKALSEFNSGLASSEFGNYTNRLMGMAGLGQAATNSGANAIQGGVNGMTQANSQQGDARASGIMGSANGIAGAINSGLNNWMLYRGGYFNKGG